MYAHFVFREDEGSIETHVFDHRDHLHHADTRRPFLAHLALPEARYAFFYGHPLLYHSRLSPEEIAPRFEAAGFERIAIRRKIYPERRYDERARREAVAMRPPEEKKMLRSGLSRCQ